MEKREETGKMLVINKPERVPLKANNRGILISYIADRQLFHIT